MIFSKRSDRTHVSFECSTGGPCRHPAPSSPGSISISTAFPGSAAHDASQELLMRLPNCEKLFANRH